MVAVFADGHFFIHYKAEILRCPWWENLTLKEASDQYRSWLGHPGELVFEVMGKHGCGTLFTGDHHPNKNQTYIARDCGSNPCATMKETETYISPFSGKQV